jgi:hypothetical protein
MKHHRSTPSEKLDAVRRDLRSGLFYHYEICQRHRVSSKTVAAVRKTMGGDR